MGQAQPRYCAAEAPDLLLLTTQWQLVCADAARVGASVQGLTA